MLIRGGGSRLRALLRDESGTSSAEYALILGVVGVGVGAATLVLGANVGSSMNGKVDDFDVAYPGATKGGGGSGGSSGGGSSGGGSSGGGTTTGGSTGGTDAGTDAGTDTGTGNGNGNGNGGSNGNAGGNGNGANKK